MLARVVLALVAVLAAAAVAGGPALAQGTPFPDVPPWHWAAEAITKDHAAGVLMGYPATPAELVRNSLAQIYDGFVHAQAAGAREWVERFTYDRPADWPGPLERTRLVAFALGEISVTVTGETATATFVATEAVRETTGTRTARAPMRVRLRLSGDDWQADYATLAAGSAVFR